MTRSSTAGSPRPQQTLLDQVRPSEADGVLVGAVFSTYSLADDANFFDGDFLPAVFGMGAVRDRGYAVPVALERRLAEVDCVLIVDSHAVASGARPSLRIPLVVVTERTQHAKVTLLHRTRLVRLIVSSANLTNDGYRTQREIAAVLDFKPEGGLHPDVLSAAIASWKESLGAALRPELTRTMDRAVKAAKAWTKGKPPASSGPQVVFGGGATPLWRRFVDAFPKGERLRTFLACSPFWSDGGSSTPFEVITSALAARNVDFSGAALRILASADSLGDKALPCFPFPAIARLRASSFPIKTASIQAVSRSLDATESKDGEGGDRRLHAKWTALVGERSFVALLGSANFTRKGLGSSTHAEPNLEASVLVTGRTSSLDLDRVLPPLSKQVVDIATCVEHELCASAEDDEEAQDYPAFIHSVDLDIRWSAGAEPDGIVHVELAADHPPFELSLGSDERFPSKPWNDEAAESNVACTPADVRALLQSRSIQIHWEGRHAYVPLNISEKSRAGLPSILGAKPDEQQLLAYFHGRLSEEGLLEQLERQRREGSGHGAAGREPEIARRFQSYIIREFVESLHGMEQSLSAAATTPRTFEQALVGEFSPLALAREVVSGLLGQRRSPTAAAFQLAELVRTLARLELANDSEELEEQRHAALDKLLDAVQGAAQKQEFVATVLGREFQAFAEAQLPKDIRRRFMHRVHAASEAHRLTGEVA